MTLEPLWSNLQWLFYAMNGRGTKKSLTFRFRKNGAALGLILLAVAIVPVLQTMMQGAV